jgi:hypothetical protein
MNVSCRDVHGSPGLGYRNLEKVNDQGKSSLMMVAIRFSDQKSHDKLKSRDFVREDQRDGSAMSTGFASFSPGRRYDPDSFISVSHVEPAK